MEENWLDGVALKIRPEIEESSGLERASQLLDTSGLLLALPLALIGVIWLVWSTDLNLIREQWLGLVLIFMLLAIFSRYTFELRLQLTKNEFATSRGSLAPLISWSGALIFGPIAIWPDLLLNSGIYAYRWQQESNASNRWNIGRNYLQHVYATTIGTLAALTVYQWLGGAYPLPGLSWEAMWPAILATLVYFLTVLLLFIPFGWRIVQLITLPQASENVSQLSVIRFLLLGANMDYVALPFAILAAGLYGTYGLGVYLFFVAGTFLASLLANRLSRTNQYSQQRSRELAILESLGRAIIDTPPDDSAALPQLLSDHIEGMFMQSMTHIWLYPQMMLYQTEKVPEFPQLEEARALARRETEPYYQLSGVRLADETSGSITHNGLIVPIVDKDGHVQGGVFVLKREDHGDVMDYLAAVQSLSAQIASALHRIDVYEQTLESEKMARELEVAGQIQASFLPGAAPAIDGWEIWAALEPARQTSGDFYDFVNLDNGRLGILVADVADKGTGAALFMALSRTLIRTYAKQYPGNPQLALQTANERIMEDTQSDQFVTVFFGVLDTANGQLVYANAGHNPAYLFNAGDQTAPQKLGHTGIPLGMFEGMSWRQKSVNMDPGDLLVMYTDGATEAQNSEGEEYGETRLLEGVANDLEGSRSAQNIAAHILSGVKQFSGDTPQFDDITLMILQRVES